MECNVQIVKCKVWIVEGRVWSVITCHILPCRPWILTLSPLDAALTLHLAKRTQLNTSEVLRLPRKMTMDVSKVLRLPQKTATNLLKALQKYCACRTKLLSIRLQTRGNVGKCHACHAKRHYNLL